MSHITIKDLSKIIGVNPSTISRALSDHQNVSAELKNKIKEVAKELNYSPNTNAIHFRKSKSMTIGVILPDLSNFFIPTVINSINEGLKKAGYRTLILFSHNELNQEIDNIKICCNARVDAILISVTNETKDLEHLSIAKGLNIPVILFDKSINQNEYDEVLIDNKNASAKCIQYLLDQNSKKILASLGCSTLVLTSEREAGIKKLLGEDYYKYYATSSLQAKEMTMDWLSKHPDIDGIFVMSDELFLGVQAALQCNADWKNIKIISISDGVLPQIFSPHSPYLNHDAYSFGKSIADFLLKKLENPQNAPSYKCILNTSILVPHAT